GFTHLGFSAHSYTEYDESCGLPLSKMEDYKKEIYRLKEKYKDKIKIYYGIEFDYYSKIDTSEFEYVIASVHGIEKNGKIYIVDESRESLIKNVNEAWGGDYMAFAEDYFETVSKQKGDIIGHIDLLTKFNENDIVFSTKDKRYLNAAKKAVEKLAQSGAIFEINTGAIQRGYRTTPYPSEDILKMIKSAGGKIMINSDCHNTEGIDCDFEKAHEYALKCGFEKSDIIGGNF
ncbi:MAG: hypothetical protein J6V03_03775, partial [Clostridia bacterium]|nr:hypothetical protein [Clostridia bacterium]